MNLALLAHFLIRRRWLVIGSWLVLTLFGAFAAGQVSTRWLQSFTVPGKSAYEASVRTQDAFGAGSRAPSVVVFRTSGDATKSQAIAQAMNRAAATMPGALTSSYFSTGSSIYVSRDRHTTFMNVYPPGPINLSGVSGAETLRVAALKNLPHGITVNVTGRDALDEASKTGKAGGGSLMVETAIGAIGALVILLFVFGTLPAVLMPLLVAGASILNTFTLVWALTYLTDVSVIVQFLIALVGLGVAIDYALLMIVRFRDELREGKDVESALVETMTHAGRSVIVSGTTVAIGLLALVLLPLPLVRSMGLAGMLIPAVSVVASITLLPALLAVMGTRINSVRVMPKRFVDRGHPENGSWGRWAQLVLKRPVIAAAVGLSIVGALAFAGTKLNANEAQLAKFPGVGTAIDGRQMLANAGVTPGVMKPLEVLVEDNGNTQAIAEKLRAVPGIAGAAAPAGWHHGSDSLVEAFPTIDGSAPGIQSIIDSVNQQLEGTTGTLTGQAAIDRDFLHVLSGSFPYVLALVVLLTLMLLIRAFRSVVLAVKAALLNLISLAASFGVIVLVFQQGHGSQLWNIEPSGSITVWIPLMIFAFLYGLSMDYEVFMLSRIREAYDETGSTDKAIELGLARTGKLVTSGALILMFAFLVLSGSPGYEVKPLAIGVGAGVILDATVIRTLLVPAFMKLMGDWNWWMPRWTETLLRVRRDDPAADAAVEAA